MFSKMSRALVLGFLCSMALWAQKVEDPNAPDATPVTPYLSTITRGGGLCDTPAGAIPDNDPVGFSSTLNVPEGGVISDLDVSLDVSHTWVGDLIVTLEHNGTVVTLMDQPGVPASTFGCGEDNISAVFDDAAATPVEDECPATDPAINGTFIPQEALAAFNGDVLEGDWTLTISDNAAGDTGTLNEWCLIADALPGIPTMSEYALMAFVLLLLGASVWFMRRTRTKLI